MEMGILEVYYTVSQNRNHELYYCKFNLFVRYLSQNA